MTREQEAREWMEARERERLGVQKTGSGAPMFDQSTIDEVSKAHARGYAPMLAAYRDYLDKNRQSEAGQAPPFSHSVGCGWFSEEHCTCGKDRQASPSTDRAKLIEALQLSAEAGACVERLATSCSWPPFFSLQVNR